MTNIEIYHILDQFAPFDTQMSFDNSGFLVGEEDGEVTKMLLSLDVTLPVVEEAISQGCELILSHHPIIFNPLKKVTNQAVTGKILLKLIQNNIAVISAHTNLDQSQDGVNHHFAKQLQLQNPTLLAQEGIDSQGRPYGLGFYGLAHAEGLSATQYADFVQQKLGAKGVRFTDVGVPVRKVAVGGGSCGSMLPLVAQTNCDTFVTGDIKYDLFLEAKELGINLLDAGHFATENLVLPPLAEKLQKTAPKLTILLSQTHKEVYSYLQGGGKR